LLREDTAFQVSLGGIHDTHNYVHALFGGCMHFEYRGFNIECAAAARDAGFIGIATVWHAPGDCKVLTSSAPQAFATKLQAIDYVRFLAEIRVDEQLTPAGAVTSAKGATPLTKELKTTS
jgi:hypothetical protein